MEPIIQSFIRYIDAGIFALFLLLNLVVGIQYRSAKIDFKEYAVGKKNFSTAALTATIVATWMSGSVLFSSLERTYSTGLYYMIAIILGIFFGLMITGHVVGPRMGKFMHHVSVPAALGALYGKGIQIIVALSSVLLSIGYVTIQLKVIAKTMAILLQHESPWITAASAAIVVLYAASGGVKAVTFTDIIQFFTFGSLLPVLALVIWNSMDDSANRVVQMLATEPIFHFKEVVGWTPEFLGTITFMSYLMTPSLPPPLFQRMAMARDVTQMKRALTYAALLCVAVELCMIWIAILLRASDPALDPSQLVQHMVHTYTYPGLRGFLGVGIIALAMSSADSMLNASAVIIANDVLAPLRRKKEGALSIARGATLAIGAVALLLALKQMDLIEVLMLSANFYMPIVVVPMLLAIMGFQTTKNVVYMGMATGSAVVATCLYFKSINGFFPGMLVNLVTMMGAHYGLGAQGGWGHNPTRQAHSVIQPSDWQTWWNEVKNCDLRAYLARTLPMQEHFYSLFGFYILTSIYASFYFLPHEPSHACSDIYASVQYSTLFLATSFMIFSIWPTALRQQRLLAWIWPTSIFYTLFFVGGLMVLMSGFSTPQMLIFTLNFTMAVLLLPWPLVLGMSVLGIGGAILFFKHCTGWASLPGNLGTLQFQIAYGLLLMSSFLIALFKYKEAYQFLERRNVVLTAEREMTNEELVRVLHHEERFFSEVDTAGSRLIEAVDEKLDRFAQQARQLVGIPEGIAVKETLQEIHHALHGTRDYLRSVIYRTQSHLRLEVDTVPLDDLLIETLEVLQVHEVGDRAQPVIQNLTEYKELQCDAAKIQQLLVNSLLYAQRNNSYQTPVILGIQATKLGYPLPSVTHHIKEIQALCITVSSSATLPPPQNLYMGITGRTPFHLPQAKEDLPLLDNQRIVDAHYGITELISQDQELVQVYVIPVYLRAVRPKMMDIPQMEVGGIKNITQPVQPEEIALLDRLKRETKVDLPLVEKAIAIIKQYHGHVKRKSGERFYLHPIATAEIVLDYARDQAVVLAALLHDTVEDTALTLAEIGTLFGPQVAAIVNNVTHLDGQFKRISMATHENTRQLLRATDPRVLQVKLADRTHNMRTIQWHSSIAKQAEIAKETLYFFVSMARHLGLRQIADELQTRSSAVLRKAARTLPTLKPDFDA